MKKYLSFLLIAMFVSLMATQCGERRQPTVYIDGVPQLNPDNIDEIIPAMTLDEKVSLLIGTGMAGFSGDDPVIGETRDLVPGLPVLPADSAPGYPGHCSGGRPGRFAHCPAETGRYGHLLLYSLSHCHSTGLVVGP
jgi:hypothetical protein